MSYKLLRVCSVMIVLLLAAGMALADEDPLAEIPQSRGDDGAIVLGDPDAAITIIEFSDYLCPACQNYEEVVEEFLERYVLTGEANFEYRFFPVIDQTLSRLTASVAECAAEMDMFWPAHRLLFELAEQREVGTDVAEVVAERLELDADALAECVEDAHQYDTDIQLGVELGVTGTPGIRVQVGDAEPGAIVIDQVVYDRGGLPVEVLAEFIESDEPAELVRIPNQLRNDRLLQEDGLVSGDPCGAPCWRGITPGETPWEDAIAIIEDDEGISDLQTQTDTMSDLVAAQFRQVDGDICCQMFADDGLTVSFMFLQTAPLMTMGEVVEVHGIPEYVVIEALTARQGYFNLFYPEVPMMVYSFVAGEQGELSESSEIIGFAYMTFEVMDTVLASGPMLRLWDGYGSFEQYLESDVVMPGNTP
jgi:protein-disulfide isomerase